MNKSQLLQQIADQVAKKHPWYVSQTKYQAVFGELPKEFLAERLAYDVLLERIKNNKICQLILSETKIEIRLTLDQLIQWEIQRHEEAILHNILPNDIKKILKEII